MTNVLAVFLSIAVAFSDISMFFSKADPMHHSTRDVTFASICAEEAAVSETEKALCRNWFNEHLVYAGQNGITPAYDFDFGFTSFSETAEDWRFSVKNQTEIKCKNKGAVTAEVTAASEKYGLLATVEATLYEENATCEWVVHLKNTAAENSPVIHNFYTANCTLETGKTDLYFNQGSACEPEDFTLYKADNSEKPFVFDCKEGRSTENYLSYFNICGEEFGFDLGIGWSGQWKSAITRKNGTTKIQVKQDTLFSYLEPQEEIRSPLVSLSFYKSTNPVKGFNTFRNWVKDCLYSENLTDTVTNVDILYVSPTRTEQSMLYDINIAPDGTFAETDNFWVDAGWYCDGKENADIWNNRFGWWQTYGGRFPNGMKTYANIAKDKGMGLVLWYEPERLTNEANSPLYGEATKHQGWVIDNSKPKDFSTSVIWNFGNKEACAYMSKYISESLKEQGATVFRQDSNFNPLSHWEYGDRTLYGNRRIFGTRKGICENHYVEGHYAFLDYLFADNENLKLYDVCASGGRRLDLEMTHRGVPMWRSDYNCEPHEDVVEATQAQTYGISCWLPFTGALIYGDGHYQLRSSVLSCFQIGIGSFTSEETIHYLMQYKWAREYLMDNYYPICSTDSAKGTVAMQFGNEQAGIVLIYKREDVTAASFDFALSGLEPHTNYRLYNFDNPDTGTTKSGNQLMQNKTIAPLQQGKQALIYIYQSVN